MSFLSTFLTVYSSLVSMWDAKREINKCGRSTRCTQNCFRLSTSGLLSKQQQQPLLAAVAVGPSY